jgi:trimeric autotransporter adhesin
MKKILFSAIIIATANFAHAQTPFILGGTSYTQNFNSIGSGLPTGWRVDTLAKKTGGLGNNALTKFTPTATAWSGTTRGFRNVASANGLISTASATDQSTSTDRALGIRQAGQPGWDRKDSLVAVNFTMANTTGLTSFNVSFKFQVLTPNSGTGRYNTWLLQYGLGAAPTSFTTIATTPAVIKADSNVFSNVSYSASLGTALDNQSQQVWLRIIAEDTSKGGGSRPSIAIDDFNLTWTGSGAGDPKPSITALTPADNSSNVAIATNVLTATFDKPISIGTGKILVINQTDGTSNQITLPTGVSVAGNTATISGVSLLNTKNYIIQMDSTCFTSTATGAKSYGIYDSIAWNFATEAPAQTTVTSLIEPFTGCNGALLGSFRQESPVGTQTWRCSTLGHNDAEAVSMNGFAGGATQDNSDWLISPPLDLANMIDPTLNFWSRKSAFVGVNTKEIFVSNNYTGNASSATWTNLNVSLSALDTNYKLYNNISLLPYKSSLIRVAFKYVSTANATSDSWWVDDINIVDGPVSIGNIPQLEAKIAILGDAATVATVLINCRKEVTLKISITDLQGRVISTQNVNTFIGDNKFVFPTSQLASGMYLIHVQSTSGATSIKFNK